MSATATPRNSYPAALAARAGTLAEDGYSASDIAAILAREGSPVSLRTVKEWVMDGYREKVREAHNARRGRKSVEASGGKITPRSTRPEYVEGRIVALGKIGLTVDQISATVALDFGTEPRSDHIRLALYQAGIAPPEKPGRSPKSVRERTCKTCGDPFAYVAGAQGRPPSYCDDCNPRKGYDPNRKLVIPAALAKGDRPAAPPTNPTGRHS